MAKLTLADGTIFEGTTEEIFAITERFSGVKAEAEALKVGDYVIISGRSKFDVDLDGKLGEYEGDSVTYSKSYARVDVSGRGFVVKYENIRKATDEEVAKAKADIAEYEQAKADHEAKLVREKAEAVFTQAGRKPNEYRKGDIVRAINTIATGLEVGHVAAVTNVDSDGDVYTDVDNKCGGKAFYSSNRVEPVTFVENRLN